MYANGRSYDSAGHEYDRRITTHRSCGAHFGSVPRTLLGRKRRLPETGSRKRFPVLVLSQRIPEAKGCKGLNEILSYAKILLVPNAHPLQVNPRIGLLSRFEGFSFVSGWPFPHKPFMSSWSGFSSGP